MVNSQISVDVVSVLSNYGASSFFCDNTQYFLTLFRHKNLKHKILINNYKNGDLIRVLHLRSRAVEHPTAKVGTKEDE